MGKLDFDKLGVLRPAQLDGMLADLSAAQLEEVLAYVGRNNEGYFTIDDFKSTFSLDGVNMNEIQDMEEIGELAIADHPPVSTSFDLGSMVGTSRPARTLPPPPGMQIDGEYEMVLTQRTEFHVTV